jgi:YVTN family beta-propeller protein
LLVLGAADLARAELAVVLNSGEDTVSLIDTDTYRELERRPIGKEPHHLMAMPDDGSLIVANAMGNELVFLDPRTGKITRRVPRISDPYQIGFSPDQAWFVSNSLRLNRVDIYHHRDGGFRLAARLPLGRAPSHLAFSPDSRLVFVTLQDSDLVTAVNLADQTIRWSRATGKQPAGVWVTPDARHVLVGVTGEDCVEVHDLSTGALVKKLPTGKGAHNFLPVGDGRRVLVSNRVADTISVIDQESLEVLETFAVPGGPDCMELSRDGGRLWVTSRWINRVTVIDMQAKKLLQSIRVGRSPHGIYFPTHAARR